MANRFAIETVFKAIDQMTAPISKMQNRVSRFTRSMDRGLRNANRAVSTVNKNLMSLGAVGLAGVTVAAFGVQRALAGVADEADRLAKLSRRIDFPIEELQEWNFVATQSGVDTKLFESSLGAFTKRLGEARAGTGSLASMLKKTNPVLLEQLTSADSASDAFALLVDAMRDTTNASDRAALASAAFSRAGLKLANISDNSADAIANLRKQQQLNGVVTMEQAKAAEAYNDAVDSASRAVQGLRNDALTPLMPILTDGIKQFRLWTIANRQLIATRLEESLRFVIDNLDNLMTIGKGFVQLLVGWMAVTLLLKTVTLAWNAAMILSKTTMIAWGVVTKAFTATMWLLNGVMKAVRIGVLLFNIALMANPIGLIVGAIGLLIAAGAALILNWDKVSAAIGGVWDNIVDSVKTGVDVVMTLIDGMLAPFKLIFSGISKLRSAASSLGIGGGASKAVDAANGPAGTTGESSQSAQVVSGSEQVARSIQENSTTTTGEVVLRDETGRAQASGALPAGVTLASSGGF